MSHPYRHLDKSAFWKKAVARQNTHDIDPAEFFPLKISRSSKVATAGSCFAQHIASHLKKNGFNYLVTENAHPLITEKVASDNQYGLFSARYGNIYTARQLLQLIKRAYGSFKPLESSWRRGENQSYTDPFRPLVQKNGFISSEEMLMDRAQHLLQVRRMFEELDVFIFTLGLTECWRNKEDGAVFPLCPGVDSGVFNSEKYEFYNQTVEDVRNDILEFNNILLNINPGARIILTVSPVPLVATVQHETHVINATTYSKSVLRVAADVLAKSTKNICYFPSYEIITSNFSRGSYFADDLRSVTEEGVNHVMRSFLKNATNCSDEIKPESSEKITGFEHSVNANVDMLVTAQHLSRLECDEERLDRD